MSLGYERYRNKVIIIKTLLTHSNQVAIYK